MAAEVVSVALADVKKHRLIGYRVVAAGMFEATSAWITAALGSESLFQKT
ncbi:hypothetical protein OCO53_10530 [Peribacillus frigoritolerans]|nr:hypothetical protein [Peribacillus frigoritolerans]MCU6600902.1 hypothetical protein [Peribacillus frigoritolerans]